MLCFREQVSLIIFGEKLPVLVLELFKERGRRTMLDLKKQGLPQSHFKKMVKDTNNKEHSLNVIKPVISMTGAWGD